MAAADRLTGTNVAVVFFPSTGTPATDEILLTGDFTSFSLNRQVDVVDVTAGNETNRYEVATIESLDFTIMIFDAKQSYQADLLPATTGNMTVYRDGLVQTLDLGGPASGTFDLTINGETASSNAYNITASALETAIEGLAGVTAGDVTVTGGPGDTTPFTLTWNLDGTAFPNTITVNGSGLSGGTGAVLTKVGAQEFTALIKSYNEDMPFDGALEIEVSGSRQGAMVLDLT